MTDMDDFLSLVVKTAGLIDRDRLEGLVERLVEVRDGGGRVFVLGVGGSAANASHAVNDFRKLCGIEAYAPADNVAELTARTNDEGWETTFVEWLRTSRLSERDAVLVLSVGGGDAAHGVSVNIVRAVDEARARGARILGIVGRDGGHTARVGDAVVIVPTVDQARITPICESFQSVLLHGVVSDPRLATATAKWEAVGHES
ncbi:MAG TPA: SIS domain-containing protein [Plantibacter sp.]|uniref:SIS domain-containing protein n=1 Tax=Plantibacter sp. TaxID=1871045 RepID=UPI002D0680C1|nr:SIS domain-containing protein [Plantibacter sp.]